MFGQNTIVKQQKIEDYDGTSIPITEIFYTLQGEGMFSGVPSVFVRVKDCCLSCHFCDTEFSKGSTMSVDDIVNEVDGKMSRNSNLVVITGGEPMIHQGVKDLVIRLLSVGYIVQIETCGAVSLDGLPVANPDFHIVVSPKTAKIHPFIYDNADAFKYIITSGEVDPDDGLPNMSTQIKGKSCTLQRPRPGATVYLTPCDPHLEVDDYDDNTQQAVHSCLVYGYTLNLQVHKIVGLP